MSDNFSSDNKTNEHRLKEIEQINLILKKLLVDISITNPRQDL
jgi:hypothetical protein